MSSEIQGFLKSISFRFIQPQTPFRVLWGLGTFPNSILTKLLLRFETWIELCNTNIALEPERKEALKGLCAIPKMSTYALGSVVNFLTAQLKSGQAFVNVGVWHGFTFLSGVVCNPQKRCVGVDNFSEFRGPKDSFMGSFNKYKSANHEFFEMDYQRYFKEKHSGPIGFYIYDGEHSYENQMQGLKVAEPFFADGCIVLVDDTNIPHVHAATMDFISQSRHKYRILLDQRTRCNAHPTFWNGIIVFQKNA